MFLLQFSEFLMTWKLTHSVHCPCLLPASAQMPCCLPHNLCLSSQTRQVPAYFIVGAIFNWQPCKNTPDAHLSRRCDGRLGEHYVVALMVRSCNMMWNEYGKSVNWHLIIYFHLLSCTVRINSYVHMQ